MIQEPLCCGSFYFGGDTISKAKNNDALYALGDSIILCVNSMLQNASYTKIYKGIIVSPLPDGKYSVNINGDITDLAVYGADRFKPNETVYVVAPANEDNLNKRFILSKSVGQQKFNNLCNLLKAKGTITQAEIDAL